MAKPINTPVDDSVKARFWAKVDVRADDECWVWTGTRTPKGYGIIRVGTTTYPTHRVSYAIASGSIDTDKSICHRCDNPPCVNPAHLFAGTHAENMADMSRKGRWVRKPRDEAVVNHARGECNPSARLQESDVRTIRQRYEQGETKVAIARAYGVHRSLIYQIVNRRIWKDV